MLRISCLRVDVVNHRGDVDAARVLRKHLHTRVIALPSSSPDCQHNESFATEAAVCRCVSESQRR